MKILSRRLRDAIQNNVFPLFNAAVEADHDLIGRPSLTVKTTLTDIGGAPAFNVRARWEDGNPMEEPKAVMPPGETLLMCFLYGIGNGHTGIRKTLLVEYESPIGVLVKYRFEVHGEIRLSSGGNGFLFSGVQLKSRVFRKGPELSLIIEDEEGDS